MTAGKTRNLLSKNVVVQMLQRNIARRRRDKTFSLFFSKNDGCEIVQRGVHARLLCYTEKAGFNEERPQL